MAWLVVDVATAAPGAVHTAPWPSTPLPLPLSSGDTGSMQSARDRSGARAFVVDDAALKALRARRVRVSALQPRAGGGMGFATSQGAIEAPPGDLLAAFLVDDAQDRHLCLARRSDPRMLVLSRGTLDMSFTNTPDKGAAFATVIAGFARIIGRPVDESLLAVAPVAQGVGLSGLDVVDLGFAAWRGDIPAPGVGAPAPGHYGGPVDARERDFDGGAGVLELASPRAAAAPAAQERVAAPVGLPVGEDDDAYALRKKCSNCTESVDARDCYMVFSQPYCDGCADPYLHGHGERMLKLGGLFLASIVVFVALVVWLDVIGRIVGALLVLFAFRMVLATGVQYDVEVDRKKGKQTRRVRSGGFFKTWGDLDAKWWGRWLLNRGVYALLGVVAWFVPIGDAIASGRHEQFEHEVAEEAMPNVPKHVLKALGPAAKKGDGKVALLEVEGTEDGAVFVLECGRGGKSAQRRVPLAEAYAGVDCLGVKFRAQDAVVPPDVPSLTIVFEDDIPAEWR